MRHTFSQSIFCYLLFTCALTAQAQNPPQQETLVDTTLNQVLFYESKQSWTSRDQELFNKLKKEVVQKERLSAFTETSDEDFLLSRLSAREALLFEVTPFKFKITEAERNALAGYSRPEIDEELNHLGLAVALVELKESQLKQKLRFKTWLDLLKRKYQFKIKSADFKP